MCFGKMNNCLTTLFGIASVFILVFGYIVTGLLIFMNKILGTDDSLTLYFAVLKLTLYSLVFMTVLGKDVNKATAVLIRLIIMTGLSIAEFNFFIAKFTYRVPREFEGLLVRTALVSFAVIYALLQFYFSTVIYRYFNALAQKHKDKPKSKTMTTSNSNKNNNVQVEND